MPVYSNPDGLVADFLRLVNSPLGADVRFIVGEEKVVMHAHSLILQARSSYFARALNSDWKESNQGVIYKPNIRPAVFERVLQYIYGAKIIIDDGNDEMIMELIKAADELSLEDLLHGCEEHASSTICRTNVLDMVHLASQHNLKQLKPECLDFIAMNIDYLKRGKPILTLDADVLKDILSMDQLDLDELEIWKIAVRWAYYQQGLPDWDQCPLLEFPKGSGCVIVQPIADDGSVEYQDGLDGTGEEGYIDDEDEDDLGDARIPIRGTNIRIEQQTQKQNHSDQDEDGLTHPTTSVFQLATSHKVVQMPVSVHEGLRQQIAPVLPAIRFMRIQSVDFLRLIEGTGLVPAQLCAKVYRYHAVPSMADPYQTSLRRRMAFSTILSKENKEVVIEWLQAALQGTLASTGPIAVTTTASSTLVSAVGTGAVAAVTGPTTASSSRRISTGMYNISPSSPIYFNTLSSSPSAVYYSTTTPPLAPLSSLINARSPPSPLLTRGFTSSSPSSSSSVMTGSSSAPLNRTTRSGSSPSTYPQSQQHQHQKPTSTSLTPPPKLILQYRATRDGFDAANFHMACDQRGPTLTVVRTENGAIFGGYNSCSWSSHPSGVYSTSRSNFLFTLKSGVASMMSSNSPISAATGPGSRPGSMLTSSLSTSSPSSTLLAPSRENMVYCIKGDGMAAAYSKADYGPTFGVGHDLYLASNCNMSCNSSSTLPATYHGAGASSLALAGSSCFRVQEYEVFLVQSSPSA